MLRPYMMISQENIESLMLRSYEKIIASCVLTEGLSPLLKGHTGSE